MTDILLRREAWGTFLGMFGGNYLLYYLLTWLPYYLVRERQFSLERMGKIGALARSEEHTSELQSRPHLVCRLLLEKKKESCMLTTTSTTSTHYTRGCFNRQQV